MLFIRHSLQAKSWSDGKVYQTGEVVLPGGQWVHFDIEDNPLTASGEKHVYLWGFLVPSYGDDQYPKKVTTAGPLPESVLLGCAFRCNLQRASPIKGK
jgi:hypothetical protein